MDVVIDFGIVSVVGVVLAFVLNQGAKLLGLQLSEAVRKGVVFAVAVGLAGYFAVNGGMDLPDPAVDPFAFAFGLLTFSLAAFKAAQVIYDLLWRPLVEA